MNCKPGDLAFIVKSDFPENVGRVVEVTKEGAMGGLGWYWLVISDRPFVGYSAQSGLKAKGMRMLVPDVDLRPISGVPLHDEQFDQVPA